MTKNGVFESTKLIVDVDDILYKVNCTKLRAPSCESVMSNPV